MNEERNHKNGAEVTKLTLLERLSGVVEKLAGNKLLLDTGEILDEKKKLWGYRVFKGVHLRDLDKDTGKVKAAWSSRLEYVQALAAKIHQMNQSGENVIQRESRYNNNMNPLEQLAMLQAGMSDPQNFAASWTRDPSEAIGFSEWPDGSAGIVLEMDVPLSHCISQEVLKIKNQKSNRRQPYPLEGRPEREKEISVFDFIDLSDPQLVKHDSTEFKNSARKVREKLRKV